MDERFPASFNWKTPLAISSPALLQLREGLFDFAIEWKASDRSL